MWGRGSWRPTAVEGEAIRGAWRRMHPPHLLPHGLGSHPALGRQGWALPMPAESQFLGNPFSKHPGSDTGDHSTAKRGPGKGGGVQITTQLSTSLMGRNLDPQGLGLEREDSPSRTSALTVSHTAHSSPPQRRLPCFS